MRTCKTGDFKSRSVGGLSFDFWRCEEVGWDGEGRQGFAEFGPGREKDEARQRGKIGEEGCSFFRRLPRFPPRWLDEVENRMPGEGEHVERCERHGEGALTMTEIVLEFVPIVFENVEGFVFDFPARSATGDDRRDTALRDRQRGDHGRLVFHHALGV